MIELGTIQDIYPDRAAQIGRILSAALDAADPRQAVRRALHRSGNALEVAGQRLDMSSVRSVRIAGAGKAAQAMVHGILDVMGDEIVDGVVITKHLDEHDSSMPERIRVLRGGHPVPTQESVSATRALIDLLLTSGEDDLVLGLVSGGGSALMTMPAEGTNLEELQALTRLLLACGANIGEMNTLRKHLDQVKGGGIARLVSPARLVTLILSDVIGSPLDVIASGPTVADSTTYVQGMEVLRKYHLEEKTPPGILSILQQGAEGKLPETVKPGDPLLDNVTNHVIASNPQAARAGLDQARREGFQTMLLTTYLQGEAAQVGGVLAGLLQQIDASGEPLPRPACLAAGGETTVTLRGQGLGGRNQELALGASFLMEGINNAALVSLGTDGEDGPTDAAGALINGETMQRALDLGLNPLSYLQNNDSYHFFQALGDLVRTGPTGTNVNDLAFLFAF